MAKGLRSKSARRAKAVRREEVFGPVENLRAQRLAKKLAHTTAESDLIIEDIPVKFSHLAQVIADHRGRSQSRNPRTSRSSTRARSSSVSKESNADAMDQDESDHEVTKSDPLTEAADDNALLDTVVDTEEALKNMSKAHRARLFMSGGKFKKWRSAESKLTRSKKIKAGRSSKK